MCVDSREIKSMVFTDSGPVTAHHPHYCKIVLKMFDFCEQESDNVFKNLAQTNKQKVE